MALVPEIQDVLHSVPSLSDVLDIQKCDAFLRNFRTGRYASFAHEEVLGGLVSICASARALSQS